MIGAYTVYSRGGSGFSGSRISQVRRYIRHSPSLAVRVLLSISFLFSRDKMRLFIFLDTRNQKSINHNAFKQSHLFITKTYYSHRIKKNDFISFLVCFKKKIIFLFWQWFNFNFSRGVFKTTKSNDILIHLT